MYHLIFTVFVNATMFDRLPSYITGADILTLTGFRGVLNYRTATSRGVASGKTCQHTSAIQRIFARSFTPQMLSNRYTASSGN